MRQFEGLRSFGTVADRSPISRGTSYNSTGIAPHIITQRFIYTVPAGKNFLLSGALVEMLRVTAAAPVGRAVTSLRTTTLLPTTNYPATVQSIDNTVGATARLAQPPALTLVAGEAVDGVTEDASTGGTMNYMISYQGTEYNA